MVLGRLQVCFVVLSLACAGCCSTDGAANPQQNIRSLAAAKFGEDFELFPNGQGDFVLCVKNEKPRPGTQPVAFFVYSTEKNMLVYERQLDNGTVSWLDDRRLSIVHIPGAITGDDNDGAFTEIFDVVSNTSQPDRRAGNR